MAKEAYISIITFNINGLNAPTKRQRLAEQIQKQDPGTLYMLSTRNPLETSRHILIKLTKTKHKERILKSSKGEATSNIQGKLHMLNS